jgi:hypothetical protein
MSATEIILREYAEDRWNDRIVSGEAVKEAELWLAEVEARQSLPPGASGKPLAWLCFVTGTETNLHRKKIVRSVGLLTDVLRVLDRPVTADEFQELFGIFERHGRPFAGTLEDE